MDWEKLFAWVGIIMVIILAAVMILKLLGFF